MAARQMVIEVDPEVQLSAAVVVSGPLPPDRRAAVVAAALDAWPFLRRIDLRGAAEHVALRAPDTGIPTLDGVTLERAFTQNEAVYDALPSWSLAYPDTAFALVEVEAVAGRCRYGGYVCQAGRVQALVVAADSDRDLLDAVGLALEAPLAEALEASADR